jgi:hypothetical protein
MQALGYSINSFGMSQVNLNGQDISNRWIRSQSSLRRVRHGRHWRRRDRPLYTGGPLAELQVLTEQQSKGPAPGRLGPDDAKQSPLCAGTPGDDGIVRAPCERTSSINVAETRTVLLLGRGSGTQALLPLLPPQLGNETDLQLVAERRVRQSTDLFFPQEVLVDFLQSVRGFLSPTLFAVQFIQRRSAKLRLHLRPLDEHAVGQSLLIRWPGLVQSTFRLHPPASFPPAPGGARPCFRAHDRSAHRSSLAQPLLLLA